MGVEQAAGNKRPKHGGICAGRLRLTGKGATMAPDKKAQTSKVVGYFCIGFSLLMIAVDSALDLSKYGLTVIAICLTAVGITCLAQGKAKSAMN